MEGLGVKNIELGREGESAIYVFGGGNLTIICNFRIMGNCCWN
jgi:hypothetical protein